MKRVLGEPAKLVMDSASFYHHHLLNNLMPRFLDLQKKGYDIITTERDPSTLCSAWVRRFGVSDHHRNLLNEEYTNWVEWALPSAAVVLHLDDQRETSLYQLNLLLDSNLTTDWKPIGHWERSV